MSTPEEVLEKSKHAAPRVESPERREALQMLRELRVNERLAFADIAERVHRPEQWVRGAAWRWQQALRMSGINVLIVRGAFVREDDETAVRFTSKKHMAKARRSDARAYKEIVNTDFNELSVETRVVARQHLSRLGALYAARGLGIKVPEPRRIGERVPPLKSENK